MVAWVVKDMGGEIPRKDPRLLPDSMAEEAWNCDLSAGPLDGLPTPQLLQDLSSFAGAVQRAYRYPGPNTGDADAWLPLPSPFSSVVRSPLANDTLHRMYWTNPNDGAYWNTYGRVIAGNTGANAPYNLGFTTPDPTVVSPSGVTPVGGTTGVAEVDRSYCYTLIDQYGAESAPSAPSAAVAGPSDAAWHITGLPTTAQAAPAGKNYPNVVGLWLYRTITGTTTGAQFYRVAFFDFATLPPPSDYVDAAPDTQIVNNLVLATASWAVPVQGLDGLIALPGGMLVGFTGNTLHFCEPNQPHAWPAAYDQSVSHNIVALALWQQSLVVLTEGFPSTGSGASPAAFALQTVQVPEPCIARGSVITDLLGVYYASQNGLVMLNYFGMQNQTLGTLTKNIWLKDFAAASILACRHRAQYLAINGTGTGFIIDYTEPRMGIIHINTFNAAVAVWNDDYTGDTYVCADKKIYLWDSPDTGSLNYRWRSKQFYLPAPVSLGAVQISASPDITNPAPEPAPVPPLDNGDASLVLPDGVNATFALFAGNGHQVFQCNLTEARSIFRLPSGFKAFDWQFELVSRVPIYSVELASTMEELRSV